MKSHTIVKRFDIQVEENFVLYSRIIGDFSKDEGNEISLWLLFENNFLKIDNF